MEKQMLIVKAEPLPQVQVESHPPLSWISSTAMENLMETGSAIVTLAFIIVLIRSLTALIKASR